MSKKNKSDIVRFTFSEYIDGELQSAPKAHYVAGNGKLTISFEQVCPVFKDHTDKVLTTFKVRREFVVEGIGEVL